MTEKNCRSCKYGHPDELNDLYCVNGKSKNCTEFVPNYFMCKHYVIKDREEESKKSKSKLKNKRVEYNGIKFHSQMELDFYLHLLTKFSVDDIELQPRYTLQSSFTKHDKKHMAITYIADFKVNGIVYDVKGMTTKDFIIKRKLFEFKYPDISLQLITKCPLWLQSKYGKWIELDDLIKERRLKNPKLKRKS